MRTLAKKVEKFNQFGIMEDYNEEENIHPFHSMGQKVLDVSDAQYDAVMEKYSNQTRPSGVNLIDNERRWSAINIDTITSGNGSEADISTVDSPLTDTPKSGHNYA